MVKRVPRGSFVDTSVFLTAAGGPHPRRDACRAFLSEPSNRPLHVNVEAVQEFVFHRMRIDDRARAVADARALATSVILHDFDAEVLDVAIDVIANSSLKGRDAVHAASALCAGFSAIVSLDADFDAVPGLERVRLGG